MLFHKLKVTLGATFNGILDRWKSPLDRLEYEREMLEDDRRRTLESLTALKTNITKLENNQASVLKSINEAQIAATKAVEKGLEDSARKILQRKLSLEATYKQNQDYLDKVNISLTNLELKIKEYETEIDNISANIEQLKTESNIADVKVKIAETTSGIGMDTYQINKDIAAGRELAAEKTARADAIEELNAKGAYDGINGKGGIESEISSLIADSSVDDELTKIKQNLQADAAKREVNRTIVDEMMDKE